MSREQQMKLFLEVLARTSAAQIARDTGYSQPTVSQVKNGKYPDERIFLAKIAEVYARRDCPIHGDIDHLTCSQEANRPYSAGRVKEWAACRKCEHNGDKA